MENQDSQHTREHSGRFTLGYDLGFVGTGTRILVGIGISSYLLAVDALDSSAYFLWQVAAWFLAILATYSAVYSLLAPRILGRVSPWMPTVLFYGPVLIVPYLEAIPDPASLALGLYIVASTMVVVLIGYGGCEVIGLPAFLIRRRRVVYCPWNTVDLVDKGVAESPQRAILRTGWFKTLAIAFMAATLLVVGHLLGDASVLVWLFTAIAAVALITASRLIGRRMVPYRRSTGPAG